MSASLEELGLEISRNQDNILALQTEISTRVAEFQNLLTEAQEKDKKLREAMLNAMEATGRTESYEDENIRITYVKRSVRIGVDTTKLQLEQPQIFEQYKKTSTVRAQIRIKVKN